MKFLTTIDSHHCQYGTLLHFDAKAKKFRRENNNKLVKNAENLGLIPCREIKDEDNTPGLYLYVKSALEFEQYIELLKHIHEKHSFMKGRNVKYIDSSIDTRNFQNFSLTFRQSSWKMVITRWVTLIPSDEEKHALQFLRPMYETAMAFLNQNEIKI